MQSKSGELFRIKASEKYRRFKFPSQGNIALARFQGVAHTLNRFKVCAALPNVLYRIRRKPLLQGNRRGFFCKVFFLKKFNRKIV